MVHSNELITYLDIRGVLHDPEVLKLYDSEIRICDKQASPLGRTLCNFTSVALQVEPNMQMPDSVNCPCRNNNLILETNDLTDGHVVSCNPANIINPEVRRLLQYGAKFRQNISAESILESLGLGLFHFVNKKLKNCTDFQFSQRLKQWEKLVYNKCKTNLTNYMANHPDPFPKESRTDTCIKQLRQIFTFCPVDKTTHNLGYVCKHYYQYVESNELATKAYADVTDKTIDEILLSHQKWNKQHKYSHHNSLFYSYPIPKMSKWPEIRWRFLAGVSNGEQQQKPPRPTDIPGIYNREPHQAMCSTTPASIYLSQQLQIVMRILQKKDNELYTKTGIRRCWFIRNLDDVFGEIKRKQQFLKNKKPRTYDFTNMYTGLEHERIKKNVREAIREAKQYAAELFARDTRRNFRIDSDLAETSKLMEHVNFIVDNTYFYTKTGILKQQKIGLPMGTNSAPECANLTCYVDERDFIDGLVNSGRANEAKEHADNFRLIDDILGWGIEPPSPQQYGLEWKETTLPDGSVIYLGAHIKKIDGRIDISIFDKAAEWPFLVLRYPHSHSNVPYHQPSGVFQGQLVRFRIICNTIKNFKHATTQMAIRMLQRDHKPVSLIKGWNTHLARFNNDRITNYTSLRQWFRRMIKWASYFVKSNRDQSHLKEKGFNKKWKNKPSTFKNGSTKWVKKQQNSDTAQYNQKSDPIQTISNFPLKTNTNNPPYPSHPSQTSHTFPDQNLSKLCTQSSVSSPCEMQDLSQPLEDTWSESHKNQEAKVTFLQEMSKISTLFTPFESMLFEFNQENDLDQSNQSLLQLLRTSTLRRYKLFAQSNPSSVICNKCDMRFGDINWIKSTNKHAKRCEEAQQMKKHLIAIWESHEKTPKAASVQKEHACTNASVQIDAEESLDRFEQWVQWDFISFHKGIHHSVLEVLTNFQKQDALQWNITNASGVCGSLVHEIGHIFRTIMARPLFRSSYYFSMGSQHTSSIQVTWRILHILLSAVNFNQKHESTQYLQPNIIQPADTWLTDEHIELLRLMVDNNKLVLPNHVKATFSKNTIFLGTFFYTKLKEDQTEALEWLQIILQTKNLLTCSGQLLLEELLVPINLNNQHWILVTIDVKHWCYFAINPYRPEHPTEFELSIASFITDALSREFNLQTTQFIHRSPDNVHHLPIQLPHDTINCGVYVSMYLIMYAFGSFQHPFIGNLLIPKSIDECRVLMIAWFLKGEIFFPSLM